MIINETKFTETLEDTNLFEKTALELSTASGELKFLASVLEEMNASDHAKKTIVNSIQRVNKVIDFILDNKKPKLVE